LGKSTKFVSITDAVAMPALIALGGLNTASGSAAFEPSINRVAADVEHPADLAFLLTPLDCRYHFFSQVITVSTSH
jgi:hypothetical protein